MFNFYNSKINKQDYSIATMFLATNNSIYSRTSRNIGDKDTKSRKSGFANKAYTQLQRKLSRFKTIGNTYKLSNESSDENNLSGGSYLLEDENVSNGDHDNPAGELNQLYQ